MEVWWYCKVVEFNHVVGPTCVLIGTNVKQLTYSELHEIQFNISGLQITDYSICTCDLCCAAAKHSAEVLSISSQAIG